MEQNNQKPMNSFDAVEEALEDLFDLEIQMVRQRRMSLEYSLNQFGGVRDQ